MSTRSLPAATSTRGSLHQHHQSYVRCSLRVRPSKRQGDWLKLDREQGMAVVQSRDADQQQQFSFHRVFDEANTQRDVYREAVAPLVSDFLAGRNCCILAYGPQHSGKSFSMMGDIGHTDENSIDNGEDDGSAVSSLSEGGISACPPSIPEEEAADHNEPPKQVFTPLRQASHASFSLGRYSGTSASKSMSSLASALGCVDELGVAQFRNPRLTERSGVAPRVLTDVLAFVEKRRKGSKTEDPILKCAVVEVYDEKLIDLLDDQAVMYDDNSGRSDHTSREPSGIVCDKEGDAFSAVAKGLARFKMRRKQMQAGSSHFIIILKLERYSRTKNKRVTSLMYLGDLADTELTRKQAKDAPAKLSREATSVKKSLGALRKILRSISVSDFSQPLPYEESILTKTMQEGLVRGAAVSALITASPELKHLPASLSAMKFGSYISGKDVEVELDESNNNRGDGLKSSNDLQPEGQEGVAGGSVVDVDCSTFHKLSRCTSPIRGADNYTSNTETMKPCKQVEGLKRDTSVSKQGVREKLEAAKKDIGKMKSERIHLSPQTASPQNEESVARALSRSLSPFREKLDSYDTETVALREQIAGLREELANERARMRAELASAQKEIKRLQSYNAVLQSPPLDERNEAEAVALRKQIEAMEKENADQKETMRAKLAAAHKEISDMKMDMRAWQTGRKLAVDDRSGSVPSTMRESPTLFSDSEADKPRKAKAEIIHTNESGDLREKLVAAEKEFKVSKLSRKRFSENGTASGADSTVDNDESIDVDSSVQHPTKEKRDESPFQLLDTESSPSPIRVCLRLRPMSKLETSRRSRSCIEVLEGAKEFTVDSPLDGEYDFCFDQVFDSDASQQDVYQYVRTPIISDVLSGVNCSLIVHGLSGSGRSHTMVGTLPDSDALKDKSEGPGGEGVGIAPRIIHELFEKMRHSASMSEFRVTCSYVAVFLDKIYDLLEPQSDRTLFVRDAENGVQVEGACEACCFDEADTLSMLRRGSVCRNLIGQSLDLDVLRSHSVFFINIEKRNLKTGILQRSYLQLAQLAGFEMQSRPEGQSAQEAKIIYKSIAALGNVIKSLTEGIRSPPYRESKLTCILKDALGGNCNTTFLITASPSAFQISETINAVRVGQRVRRVMNQPRANVDINFGDYKRWLADEGINVEELAGDIEEFANIVAAEDEEGELISEIIPMPLWKKVRNIAETKTRLSRAYQACQCKISCEQDEETTGESTATRIESFLTDIQSEAVILRRQNVNLVSDKRARDEELAAALRENKLLDLQNSELQNKLKLAESRAREFKIFLRYMRVLCWKLQKDASTGRPVEIQEVTYGLNGAPDLTELVDLDSLMEAAGLIATARMSVDDVEDEFFDYLMESGLVVDEAVLAEDEIDELAGFDDSIRSERLFELGTTSRWQGVRPATRMRTNHVSTIPKQVGKRHTIGQLQFGMNINIPWLRNSDELDSHSCSKNLDIVGQSLYTSREYELQRDLHKMADRCVELQVQLNQQTVLVERMTNKSGSLNKRRLIEDATKLRKENDRLSHNVKAATWKLQELHIVNKILAKQVNESKRQVSTLEDGFHKLQDSLRRTVHQSVDSDRQLRERLASMQATIDSLAGSRRLDGTSNLPKTRMLCPIRGQVKKKPLNLVDPTSAESKAKSLMMTNVTKSKTKIPTFFVKCGGKHVRRSRRKGTAILGRHRKAQDRRGSSGTPFCSTSTKANNFGGVKF